MIVPWDDLSDDALDGALTEIVTRDGTELSDAGAKVASLRKGLASGRLLLVFDPAEGMCSVARREDALSADGEDLTVATEEDDGPTVELDTQYDRQYGDDAAG